QINPPTFDPQFNVRSGGVVGQRVHLNVDYDSKREFEASNNIQVYYQGMEDEILRRVDVGNVTFAVPSSRFITAGIPSNNFGIQAQGQIGALDFTGIFAQQKGNVIHGRTFTIGSQTVQTLDRDIADRDFEPLRFFFVVDPATLPGFPELDVLQLAGSGLPASAQVTQVRVYRRRSSLNQTGSAQQNLSGISAVALRPDSPQRAGPFPWELLSEGRDYYLDASGLWIGLAARLDQDDYLAVSYVTAAGDTVGTFPGTAAAGRVDTLRLVYEPRRGADVPTFRYEMRNFYRVGAQGDVVRETAGLRIIVGESERPASGAATFLAQLRVAQQTDQTTFDQLNRLFPRTRDPGSGSPLKDYFVVFPSLRPFADSTALPAQFRNDSLYRTPTYLLRTQGPTPLYTLRLHYDARGGDDRSVLSLGGLQIREGSEKITADGRQLTRNVDYTINYEVGQVTFTSPDSLFQGPTAVTVQYEEQPAFSIAPTAIYGLQARYDFGEHGTLTGLGLLQRQRTTFTRPPLGFEPSSNFVGGVTGNFRFAPDGLTRALNHLPFVSTEVPSQITLDAELATSRPSPNQVGVAYVETFEEEGGIFLGLGENLWEYGSRPASPRGLEAHGIDAVLGFQDQDAVPLTWQNLIGNSTGVVQFRTSDIDPSVVVQGTGTTSEPVLWFQMYPDTVGGLPDRQTGAIRWYVPHTDGPRWRSITQPLSATGADLSRIEYLELWVYEDNDRTARAAGATLALDFGSVFEDAVDFLPQRFTVSAQGDTVFSGRRRAAPGRLQTERDTLTGAWNATINDNGILGDVADSIQNATTGTTEHNAPLCESELSRGLVVYSWGDLREHCTRHNGQVDSDDLNGDGHLDTLITATAESYFRYVFPIGDDRYYVRDGGAVAGSNSAVAGRWRLYRIPFRSDTIQVGAPNIRLIQHLRMTLVVPGNGAQEHPVFFALARIKLVGAPWVKRAATPIPGLGGAVGTVHGEVVA
ncbi:MAG: cell surface protein SprA, partial [Gemmatimonadales bacterium]